MFITDGHCLFLWCCLHCYFTEVSLITKKGTIKVPHVEVGDNEEVKGTVIRRNNVVVTKV